MLLVNNFHLLITSSTNNLQPNHPTTSRRNKTNARPNACAYSVVLNEAK